MSMSRNELLNKVKGAMFCFAIGDAMGATTEFMDRDAIKKKYGFVDRILGGGWLNIKPGKVTDDTQMMYCVYKAWELCPRTKSAFIKKAKSNFISWLDAGPIDVGSQCANAITALKFNRPVDGEAAIGNGSLMRALPLALLGRLAWNIAQGDLTHPNDQCREAITIYTHAINGYLYDKPVEWVQRLMEPSGKVRNTLNNALYYAQSFGVKGAITGAVNNGGDADTIAALAGGLVGAKEGYEAIPESWIRQLSPNIKIKLEIASEKIVDSILAEKETGSALRTFKDVQEGKSTSKN